MTAITGRIVTPDGICEGTVRIENGRIAEVTAAPIAEEGGDFGGAFIVPGFIDVHLHGIGAFGMFEVADIVAAAALQVRYGTTGFLPGVASQTEEQYLEFGRNVREAQQRIKERSARILGAHFEGPFINPERKGGMDARYLRAMDLGECRRYLDEVGDVIRLMTLSPELDGSEAVIRLLREHGVVVSLGHSDATPEDLQRAVEAGLSQVCHLFNTFRPSAEEHRGIWQSALLTAILAHDALNCEIICDMHHVVPENVKIVARVLAPDRFIAITDSMTGAGLPPGEYEMADGRRYTTKSGVGTLLSDGTIVGSVLTMNRAFRNLVEVAGLDPALAARFTATNPARAMGISDDVGSIEPGKRADMAVLDENYDCIATFVGGELIHDARSQAC